VTGQLLGPGLAAAAVVAVVLAVVTVATTGRAGDPPPGAAIGADDRRALAAVPVRRGPPPAPVDPAVDAADPRAVARAYLVATYSIEPDPLEPWSAGRTHRAGAGYALPGSPAAEVGMLVLDPPPAGSVRTAAVTALELVAADPADRRRGYRAELGLATGPPGAVAVVEKAVRDVVLVRVSGWGWLVAGDTTANPNLSAGADS
jgi:hypothetical protein